MKGFKKIVAIAVLGAAAVAGLAPTTASAAVDEKDDIVLGNDLEIYTFRAFRGEVVMISLRGDGDTDLDLLVLGPNGERVLVRAGPTDREIGTFTAPAGGQYSIGVKNHGGLANAFTLRVIR